MMEPGNGTAPQPGQDGGAGPNESTARNSRPQDEVLRFLNLIVQPGNVFEVRAPNCREREGSDFTSTVSGYYEHSQIAQAALEIGELDASGRAPAIYITLNPTFPSLLARATNHLKAKARETTGDKEIARRCWILIDCDPVRPSGISAAEAELKAAGERARSVRLHLQGLGWPDPVGVMSGNGIHLLYRIDLPADDGGLVQRVLKALAARFDDDLVKIDTSVANAARITKVAGTMARKGEHLVGVEGVEDRPHRRARLLHVPEAVHPVPQDLLDAIASEVAAVEPRSATRPTTPRPSAAEGRFERFEHTPTGVRGYLEKRGVTVKGEKRDAERTLLSLAACPVRPDCQSMGTTDIAILVGDDGRIGYRNCHNRGAGVTWTDVREALEPGYKAHVEAAAKRRPVSRPTSVRSVGSVHEGPPTSWPEPQPLPEGMPAVLPFDPALLPESFRAWIVDIAERIQCPPDFPAVAAMIGLAAVVGRRVGIRPKRQDDWLVVPNLWGGVIGRPGVMKTPAIQEPLKPLLYLEMAAKREFDAKSAEYEASKLVNKVRGKQAEQGIREALKKKDEANARQLAMESLAEDEREPVRRRYIVNDSTVEKIGEILKQNPAGVLVYRDELIGLLKSLDKEGQEGARAFFLEAWNGTGRYIYDRIGRGTIDIEAAILSVIGAIQPGPISQYLAACARHGAGDDGLMQRFQLMVWPDVSKEWVNVDRWPDTGARERAWDVFRGLAHLDPLLLGADRDKNDINGIPFLRLDGDAQAPFDDWRTLLEGTVRSGDLHPALESHLAKYRSLIPSLALLIHLAEGHKGPIGLGPLRMAIGWGRYLESHARRIYSLAIQPDLAAARALAKHLEAGDLTDGFALRDVYRKGWSCLSTPEEAQLAVDYLIDLGWLERIAKETGGRTAAAYLINPRLGFSGSKSRIPPSQAPAKGDTSRASGASGGSVSDDSGEPPDFAPPSPPPPGETGEEGTWTA